MNLQVEREGRRGSQTMVFGTTVLATLYSYLSWCLQDWGVLPSHTAQGLWHGGQNCPMRGKKGPVPNFHPSLAKNLKKQLRQGEPCTACALCSCSSGKRESLGVFKSHQPALTSSAICGERMCYSGQDWIKLGVYSGFASRDLIFTSL